MFYKLICKKKFILTLIFTWIAYYLDYQLFSQLNNEYNSNKSIAILLFIGRALSYFFATYSLLMIQFETEGKLKILARERIESDYAFYFSSMPQHLGHFYVPSLIRILIEIPALTLFIIIILYKWPQIKNDYGFAVIIIIITIIIVAYLQRMLAKKALLKRKEFDKYIDSVNHCWQEIKNIDLEAANYVQNIYTNRFNLFKQTSSIATALSQSVRLQLEVVVGMLIFFDNSLINIGAAIGYIFYRVGTSSLVIAQSLISVQAYREYRKYIDN
jgi:hypothetical protein